MKPLRLFFLLLLFVLAPPSRAQDQAGQIVFDSTEHDFGDVEEGIQARHVFTFRNDGAAPLRLKSVRPSCGCTTPEWTQQPVAPGGTGTITVVYDSAQRPGAFHKSIDVLTDGTPDRVTLHIRGQVLAAALADTYRQGALRFDRDRADLGAVPAGDKAFHTFAVQNAGARPIRFLSAHDLPENVAVALPTLPVFAGDLAKIDVVLATGGLEGGAPFAYTLVIETDDAEQPLKTIHLEGRVAAPGGS